VNFFQLKLSVSDVPLLELDKIIREKTDQRASRLEVLQTHGALEGIHKASKNYI
jgi:uncharacterized protein YydD (DUF2326 family)